MKTICTLLFVIVTLTTAAAASAQSLGLAAGVFDGDFAADLRKDFNLGGDVSQVTGQAGIVARNDIALRVQADYHWLISTSSGATSRFYPLAGLSFATDFDDAKFGVNLGGGFNFMLTQKTAAFVEAKFTLWGWDGFGIMGGFYF